jgi:hypothetical protein
MIWKNCTDRPPMCSLSKRDIAHGPKGLGARGISWAQAHAAIISASHVDIESIEARVDFQSSNAPEEEI